MIRTVFAAALLGTTFAASASAQQATDEAVAAAIAVFEENGCRLVRAELVEGMESRGFARPAIDAAAMAVVNRGLVGFTADGATAILKSGETCGNTALPVLHSDPEIRAAIFALYEERGCSAPLSIDPRGVLGETFDPGAVDAELAVLVNGGGFVFAETGGEDVATLVTGPTCKALYCDSDAGKADAAGRCKGTD